MPTAPAGPAELGPSRIRPRYARQSLTSCVSSRKGNRERRMRLKGKTAIVTGGGQGLGAGMALRFAQEGANIVVVDRNPETTPAVVRRIEQAGGKAMPMVTDLYQVANIDK